MRRGAESIARAAAGRPLALLVENAGVWPQRYAETRQGFEIAFGVNVLAHFVLRRALAAAGLLGAARMVVLTGDIYILQSQCTPDYRWSGALGGMQAYCRSKLGNLWIGRSWRGVRPARGDRRASGGGGHQPRRRCGRVRQPMKRLIMIPPELGAQMPLVCATQPGLESGGYWHNVHGRMRLAPGIRRATPRPQASCGRRARRSPRPSSTV